jgi:YYY domain-containing protein
MSRPLAWEVLGLTGIVGLALTLRFIGLDWDQGYHLHPDERFMSIVLTEIQPPPDLATYFDPLTSAYNPFNQGISFFVYGTLPLFLVDLLSSLLGLQGYDQAYLVGRGVSAVMDTGTVVLVFMLGRQLLSSRAGLLAALLMALAVHSIQLSHFFAVDTFSTFFSTAALWFLIRFAQGRRWFDLVLLGLATGLAVASKLSAGLLVVLITVWWFAQGWREGQFRSSAPTAIGWLGRGALVALLVAITFRLAQPYAFASGSPLDWRLGEPFLSAVSQQQEIQTGNYDWPPGVQWANTPPYLFPIKQIVQWGVGPAFGVAALIGIGAAVVSIWRGNGHPLALPLVWAGLNFLYSGALVLKTMRYFHPIYPVLALVVAWLFLELWHRRKLIPRVPTRIASPGIALGAAVTVVATAVWAFAFMQIYGREHPRVEASTWIYANLPTGTRIVTEHWDDQLPLPRPGDPHLPFELAELQVFERENLAKRTHLIDTLSSADALILASDRGLGTIPGMPQRYPLAGRYYQALLNGELGFRLAAEFESRPSLGPWTIDDSGAEEAFTVYDHPRVSAYVREATDVAKLVTRSLQSIDERGAIQVLPRVAVAAPIDLTPEKAEIVRHQASWPDVYTDRPLEGLPASLGWYAAGLALTLALWPAVGHVMRSLPDAGYVATRLLAPAIAVLPAWWVASLEFVPYGLPSIACSTGTLALGSAAIGWRSRDRIWAALRPRLASILIIEILFAAAFAGFVALRAANPDLWHPVFGGEKPMDYAHLNAIIRSPYFPPYDPWYAGGHLNYYYFGHVPTASLSKILGVPPSTAYNLALASYVAGAIAAVFAVCHGVWSVLSRPGRRAALVGLAGVLLVAVVGNLQSIVQLVEISADHAADPASGWSTLAQVPATIGGHLGADYDFWSPTRVIPGTVNEFPWFTFIYGDLHPHLMNLGFTAVALLGALTLVALGERRRRGGLVPTTAWLAALGLQAFVLGLHRVTNPWDFPTYLLVTLVTLGYAILRADLARGRNAIALVAAATIGVTTVSHLLFLPFHQHYVDFFGGVAPTPETTSAFQWLLIFGLPTAVALTLAVLIVAPKLRALLHSERLTARSVAAAVSTGVVVVTLVASLVAGNEPWSARVLLAALAAIIGIAAWQARDEPLRLVPLALFGAAVLLTAIPELVTVRDDIGRLNTVFKLHLQAWVLAGLGAAIALPQVIQAVWMSRSRGALGLRSIWTVAIAALVAIALVYPLAATPHKLGLRIQQLPASLDGEAFLDGAEITDQGARIGLTSDLAALRWLRESVPGAPTIVEAPTTIYRWGGRVSVYTGLPAVVGWDWHSRQQHWGYVHRVDARLTDMQELFTTADPTRARELLDRYNVDLIYIGELERAHHDKAALTKFEQMSHLGVTPEYVKDEVTIYRVTPRSVHVNTGPAG